MKHALDEISRLVASPNNMSSFRCCRQHQRKSKEGYVLWAAPALEQGPE